MDKGTNDFNQFYELKGDQQKHKIVDGIQMMLPIFREKLSVEWKYEYLIYPFYYILLNQRNVYLILEFTFTFY